MKDAFSKELEGYSAVVIRPTKLFLSWLEGLVAHDPGKRPVKQIYSDIEATVWLMPRLEVFRSHEEISAYVASRKPAILLNEVQRVY